MDGIFLTLFLVAAFVGGFASGLAGFAMGFVVSGIWLHILTPIQTTALIVGYGLLVQGYGVWKLRHSLKWQSIAPFIVGGIVGIPIGTMLLTYLNPAYLRGGDLRGVWLGAASGQSGARERIRRHRHRIRKWDSGRPDWTTRVRHCCLVSVSWLEKDFQRTVFQPVILAAMIANAISLGIAGAATHQQSLSDRSTTVWSRSWPPSG